MLRIATIDINVHIQKNNIYLFIYNNNNNNNNNNMLLYQ